MQGGDNGEAEDQPNNQSEGIDEPPPPALARENVIKVPENEVDMREEKINGEKRGPSECGERPGNGKLRRREGIKRNLRDIKPVSYEEYEDSWDLEDQSKKCKRAANCLLASCECRGGSEPIGEEKGELPVHVLSGEVADGSRQTGTRNVEREQISDEEGDLPVHLPPGAGTGMDRRASTRAEAGAPTSLGNENTGRYSNAAAVSNTAQTAGSLNHTTDTVSQLYSKPRRLQSSWSQRILRTMITLMLFITSICTVEGNSGWRESAFKIQAFDCNTPTMINKLHLPDVCFIPENLKYLEPQNACVLRDLNNRVENGGWATWLNIHNDKAYLHPLRREPGLFARHWREIVYEYSCKMLEIPIAKAPICFRGITTLYIMEELKNWERLLNVLCNEESCSYGGQSALDGMNLEDVRALLQNRKNARTEPVQMERLLTNVESQ